MEIIKKPRPESFPEDDYEAAAISAEEYVNPPKVKQAHTPRLDGAPPPFATMPRCKGLKADGDDCQMICLPQSEYCRWHIPRDERIALRGTEIERTVTRARAVGKLRGLVLPKDLAQKYELILSDPALVELKTDIAFTESRIQTVTSQIAEIKEGRGILRVIKKIIDSTAQDLKHGRVSPMTALESIKILVNKQWSTHLLWEEVYALTEQKRKLVETESKRMKDLDAYLTPEQAFGIVSSLVAIANDYVSLDKREEFQERVAKALRIARGDYRTPVDEVIESAAYQSGKSKSKDHNDVDGELFEPDYQEEDTAGVIDTILNSKLDAEYETDAEAECDPNLA